jgi:hypothetical protein
MSDKIQLAEGQRSAEYTIEGNGSLEELGKRLDQFFASVDYATTDIGGVNLDVEVNQIRNYQSREPLMTSFSHSATVTLWSRKYA